MTLCGNSVGWNLSNFRMHNAQASVKCGGTMRNKSTSQQQEATKKIAD
jgi:hypothetical protein